MASTPPQKAVGSVFADAGEDVADRVDSLWRHWTDGYAHAVAFQTARAALRALLVAENVRRLWLPAYVCDVTVEAAPEGCEVRFYGHGPGLLLSDLAPETGDAVLGVNYYGRIDPSLTRMAGTRRDVLWIEDRAQALAPGAPWGDVLLYSPRKLLGVADGGVMVANRPLPHPEMPALPGEALWAPHAARSRDPDGLSPHSWSPAFQAREAQFDAAPRAMQPRTRAVLEAVALAPLRDRRIANARTLQAWLPEFVLWAEPVTFPPLTVPIRVQSAESAVRALAAERIFCARHWAHLPSPTGAFPEAHSLARQLVSLPCDQRYDAAEMARVAEAVRRLCLSAVGSR